MNKSRKIWMVLWMPSKIVEKYGTHFLTSTTFGDLKICAATLDVRVSLQSLTIDFQNSAYLLFGRIRLTKPTNPISSTDSPHCLAQC